MLQLKQQRKLRELQRPRTEAANSAAASAEKASLIMQQLSNETTEAASSSAAGAASSEAVPASPWNQFQRANAGKKWGTEKMRAEYNKSKCANGQKMP